MSSHGTCNWHHLGVPSHFQGEPAKWRWFVPGCPACVAKWVGREIPAGVLLPEALVKASRGVRVDWVKRHRMRAVQVAKYLR